jgi:hypothetical protein
MSNVWLKICEIEKGNFLVANFFTGKMMIQHNPFLSKRGLKEEEKDKVIEKLAKKIIDLKEVSS